jgi:GT2 family glycosyltransferase
MNHPRKLHPDTRRPYYITAPAYRRSSAGIRVMHLLCHALNRSGEEAYILTDVVNPALSTPQLTDAIATRHRQAGREPIAVYPEIVKGNPLKARSVVRYVLNTPGLIGGDKEYADTELIYAYGKSILPPSAPQDNILFLPSVETDIFHDNAPGEANRRSGVLIYPGRYSQALTEHPEIASMATVITSTWPETRQAMADLFRRSEILYCFESTAVALEAVLCGCAVAVLPSPFFSGHAISGNELGQGGIAFSKDPQDIDRAKRTVGEMQANYQRLENQFWIKLDQFIAATQAMPQHEPVEQPAAVDPAPPLDSNYLLWRSRNGLTVSKAELLAQRMVLQWRQRPNFQCFLNWRAQDRDALVQLVQSLDGQLYPDWMLTVITDLECPVELQRHNKLQWLALKDPETAHLVLQHMSQASPADWLVFLPDQATLAPHALQMVADAVNTFPAWKLIYSDSDSDHNGRPGRPQFKPDLNPDWLLSQNYVGDLVFVDKQSFLSCGGAGTQAQAMAYDILLRVMDHSGVQSIGHLPEMLWSQTCAQKAPTAERLNAEVQAIEDHLQRKQWSAEIGQGLCAGTRHIKYRWEDLATVSCLIVVKNDAQYLAPLLDSWQAHSPQAVCELVLIDGGSSDPDEAEFLQSICQRNFWKNRVRIVDAAGLDEVAALNLGVANASGDLLLCLDVRSHIIQPDWLEQLTCLAQRPDVGLVAPRLIDPKTSLVRQTSWITGLHGLADGAWHNLPLTESALQDRALTCQTTQAIAPSAALVRRSALKQGPLLTPGLNLDHAWLDLALRLRQEDHSIVWTPHAMIVQHDLPPSAGDSAQDSMAKLLDRWLPTLAADPYYNCNLSLHKAYTPDTNHTVSWDFRNTPLNRWLVVKSKGALTPELDTLIAAVQTSTKAVLTEFEVDVDSSALTLLMEIARSGPDAILLSHSPNPVQPALLQLLGRHLPSVRRVVVLENVDKIRIENSLCPVTPGLIRSHLRPQLKESHTVVVPLSQWTHPLQSVHPDVRATPASLNHSDPDRQALIWLQDLAPLKK